MDYISFFDKFLSFLTHRLIQPISATEAPQQPQAQPQANGSQSVQSQEQAPPVPGPSPLPQQIQQLTIDAAPRSKSPLPTPQQTQQQPPMFPPGVKVSQAEQQLGAGTSETPQSFAPPQSSSTSQQIPPARPSLPSTFPGSLSDLVVSFESVKQKGIGFFLSLAWST
jgi:CCR4-NOT transcription complex subunit 3